jgi:hypothetical protein
MPIHEFNQIIKEIKEKKMIMEHMVYKASRYNARGCRDILSPSRDKIGNTSLIN